MLTSYWMLQIVTSTCCPDPIKAILTHARNLYQNHAVLTGTGPHSHDFLHLAHVKSECLYLLRPRVSCYQLASLPQGSPVSASQILGLEVVITFARLLWGFWESKPGLIQVFLYLLFICVCVHAWCLCVHQRETRRVRFSPSTVCVSGLELGLSGLVASVFTC